MDQTATISLLVFGILVSLGGVFGFLKAKSKASLLSGLISGALLITCHSMSRRNPESGFLCGMVVTGLLIVVFGIRLFKTKKFMPSGMLLVLSIVEEIILALGSINETA